MKMTDNATKFLIITLLITVYVSVLNMSILLDLGGIFS